MLVKDIIKLACEFMDKAELAEKMEVSQLDEDETKLINELLRCFNLIREEISTEILPIVKVDKLKTQNLKIDFSDFSFEPVCIMAVKDSYGRNVRHRVLENSLIAFASEVEVWYSIKPEILQITDDFSSTLPERVFAYGIVREYYIKKALYKDAEVWEERFKNSIEMLSPKKAGRIILRRRWL